MVESESGSDEFVPPKARTPFVALIVALRPKQWTKNLLLFAGLLFTVDVHHHFGDFARAAMGFVVFSLLSGSGYILNDVLDAPSDRNHPRKRYRPIASGELQPVPALVFAAVAAVLCLALAFTLNLKFGLCALVYLVTTAVYTLKLKHVVILDLLTLALGFVLRAIGGAWVIPVPISPWLVLCTLLLALFLGIAKRRGELVAVNQGRRHGRPILNEYSEDLLDQMSTIVTSALLMSYVLYTIESPAAHHHNYLLASIPFVIYGIFRYLYLVHRHSLGESPEDILIKDKSLLASIVLWAIATGIIIAQPWSRW